MSKDYKDSSLGIHPSRRMEIAEKKIEDLGLKEEESKMIDIVDKLMQQYSEDGDIEKYETSMNLYFEEMIRDHLASINTGLNQFLGKLKKENITPSELEKAIENLMDIVNSDAIEEMKEVSSEQLRSLHNSIVKPLKAHMIESFNLVQDNANSSHGNLVQRTKRLAQQLSDIIQVSIG